MMNKKDMIKIFMEMFKEFDDVLEVDNLQKMLSVSRASVYTLLKNKEIKAFKIAGAYKIPKACVIEYIMDKTLEEERKKK